MAIRTVANDVIATLGDDYDGSRDLSMFIRTASVMIDRVVSLASSRGLTISSEEALLLETWVAAHAYAMSDQTYASKSTGKSSASFHGQTGMGLDATKYGQMAKSLDTTGLLSIVASGKTAGGFWAGRRPSEQTDYIDRR